MWTELPPVEETYASVKRLLVKYAFDFKRKFGGDIDDLLSITDDAFLQAYRKYTPNRAKFSTFLCWVLRSNLMNYVRKMKRNSRYKMHGIGSAMYLSDSLNVPVDYFLLENERLAGLSIDSKQFLELTIDHVDRAFSDVTDYVRVPDTWQGIRDHLRRLGWTKARIAKCVNEIREMLAHV